VPRSSPGARGAASRSSPAARCSGAEGAALGAPAADADIANLAATAELLAIDFYRRAIASKRFDGDELGYMGAALENEQAHYAALRGILESATPKGLRFSYPRGSFSSARSIGRLGQALETAFVGAYMGAVTALRSNELKGVAAQIGANESRHLSGLTNIGAGQIVPAPALPKVLSAAQATAAVRPFLAT
jgi:hypothetical protein